jgi:hypothetical protein
MVHDGHRHHDFGIVRLLLCSQEIPAWSSLSLGGEMGK